MGTDLNMFQIISYYTRYHGYQSKSKLEIDTSDGWVDRPRLSLDFYFVFLAIVKPSCGCSAHCRAGTTHWKPGSVAPHVATPNVLAIP